jgi:cytochrome c biogenesis protein CcmG/thiol:disulfide interchange protein DsbE
MKRAIPVVLALSVVALLVFVLYRGFGGNPHEVPFMLSGKQAPPFRIKRLDTDEQVSLNDFKGRPIVLNFWATWCGPCKMEHPVLEYAWKKYHNDAVFLGIVFEDNEANTKRFLAENGWTFPQLFDPKSTVAVDYGVAGVPETYFITKEGVIVGKVAAPFTHPRQIDERMKGILQ